MVICYYLFKIFVFLFEYRLIFFIIIVLKNIFKGWVIKIYFVYDFLKDVILNGNKILMWEINKKVGRLVFEFLKYWLSLI